MTGGHTDDEGPAHPAPERRGRPSRTSRTKKAPPRPSTEHPISYTGHGVQILEPEA